MDNSPATLEAINEKLDQILTYQKNAHRWAVVKGVINFLLFFVLVILPIIWAYSLIRTFAGQVDFTKLASQYTQAAQLLDEADTLKGQLKNEGMQEILNKIPSIK
jgi:hypothetical protein